MQAERAGGLLVAAPPSGSRWRGRAARPGVGNTKVANLELAAGRGSSRGRVDVDSMRDKLCIAA